MKNTLSTLLLLGAAAFAQDNTIHVTSVQDRYRTRDEPSFSKPYRMKIVKGKIGTRLYTLEEASLLAYHFEVGKDYPVVKVSDKEIKVRVTNKKGKESTESLNVVSIEEVNK
jgi:hypothetical protein